ncbi:MAG TPA: acyl carrier protein [Lachnospiraceae bacterium]|jgi:acyl carrier protein|nr:acyl carrier protein [Lachnospiraceae bacterium]HAV27531.1 acyl carrier protein [Lachnospiraceae bacterium]
MEFEKIKEITAGILNISPESITERSSFYEDLGADSLDLFQILTLIEDTFDVDIAEKDLELFRTVGDAARALAAAR